MQFVDTIRFVYLVISTGRMCFRKSSLVILVVCIKIGVKLINTCGDIFFSVSAYAWGKIYYCIALFVILNGLKV